MLLGCLAVTELLNIWLNHYTGTVGTMVVNVGAPLRMVLLGLFAADTNSIAYEDIISWPGCGVFSVSVSVVL